MYKLYLSVHDIVDIILRTGHLDNRVFNKASMQEGTRLHSLYQGEQGSDYLSEYPIEYAIDVQDIHYVISGKADGVIIDKNGHVTVEEIKTTVADLEEFSQSNAQWHLGQALFYAYVIAKERNLSDVDVVLTYIKQNNFRQRKQIKQNYVLQNLENFVLDVLLRYTHYFKKILRLKEERNESVKSLVFPFKECRKGQQEMMDFVAKASEEKKQVFIEAPTGIGKTISVLYPLVKRFGENKVDRLFYLTNKNSIKKIAMNTLSLFASQGIKLKAIEFTSKENICFNDKKGHCNPDECPFARNYYDKLLDAIFDALYQNDMFDRLTIEHLCYQTGMCPFEFQINLSAYCDVLVMDYSYVYDYHDRLSLVENNVQKTHTLLCVDECHNLPSRVRDMYSITIDTYYFKKALSMCLGLPFLSLKHDLESLLDHIENIPIPTEDENVQKRKLYILPSVPTTIENDVSSIFADLKEIIKKHTDLVTDPLLDFFYEINAFNYLMTLLDDEELNPSFLFYLNLDEDNNISSLRIANLDSTPLIKAASTLFESVIYFSATLSPKDYYIDLLGGDSQNEENKLVLSSPFPIENRRVFVNSHLSLLYKDRDNTLYDVYRYIKCAIEAKKGNYFVFCPSFDYLESLKNFFQQDPLSNTDVFYQGHSMSENGREEFLSHFAIENEKTTVGVLVIGGIFSEGIDLVGDRLIGCIIISVGLPQINFETDRIKDYYDKKNPDKETNSRLGFNYAYSYPGINRVLQAAGRVIRTDSDKGFLLFIDSRYRYTLYRNVFKDIYPDGQTLHSLSQLRMLLRKFWEEKDNDL